MRRLCFLGLLVLAGCGGASEAPTGDLSFLTYNVHGLPSVITGDDTAGRIAQIAPLLNDFDLVGLQEDFIDEHHAILAEVSEHPTQVRFAEVLDGDRYYGSGLAVFASLPEEDHLHVHFEACHGHLDGASDCLASKGFQAVRLSLGAGASIDVYNSHLEAGGSPEDAAARASHVTALLEAMTGWSSGRALVFLGDTNLHPGDAEDQPELDRLLGEAGLTGSCDVLGCPEPGHIDRVLFRSGQEVQLEALSWTNEPGFVDAEGLPLSDHPAISAELRWSLD
ncbi:MAG: endonuclease/exonuclease/phosphatase family protein [Myxococcota bacterium]|nr:endonuclease/exonuclease/phosphatase family protein [Myxococcota bacterium]